MPRSSEGVRARPRWARGGPPPISHPPWISAVALTLFLALSPSGTVASSEGTYVGEPWMGAIPPSNLTLSSISVEATATEVTVGGTLGLSASPICVGGPCPAGIVYQWAGAQGWGTLGYSPSGNSVVATLTSGGEVPAGVAYDSGNGEVYITNDNAYAETTVSNVSVISAGTNTLLRNVPVGASPSGIAYDPDNGDLYVANCGSENMSVIDGADNQVVASIPMDLTSCTIGAKWYMNFAPVAFDPADRTIYVSYYGTGTVGVVNTTTDQVVAKITVGGQAYGLAYDPVNGDMYASEFSRPFVAVIQGSTNVLLRQVEVSELPSGVAVDPVDGDVYVADASPWVPNPAGDGNVAVIDGTNNSLLTTIPTLGYPWNLAFDPDDDLLYETDSNTTVMKIISPQTNSVIANVSIGAPRQGTSTDFDDAYDPANGLLYVTGINWNQVNVVGVGKDNATFQAAGRPGIFNVTVNATWDGFQVGSPPLPITVEPSSVPVISSLRSAPDPALVDHPLWINATAVGGTGPLSFAFSGLPSGCATSNAAQLRCVPTTVGEFSVRLYVNDSAGDSSSATLLVTVDPITSGTLSIASFSISPSTVESGATTFFNVTAYGGTGDLAFAYSGLPSGCTSADVTSLACTPAGDGNFSVRVFVNDTSGASVSDVASLRVLPLSSSGLAITSFAAYPPNIILGGSTTLVVTAKGGEGVVAFSYLGLPEGCSSASTASLGCTPGVAGDFAVRVFANDSSGGSASAVASLVVASLVPNLLTGVAITPLTATVPAGDPTGRSFLGTPSCSGAGGCPLEVTFTWSLSNALGTVRPAVGASVLFVPGEAPGETILRVTATFDGSAQSATATVTITAQNATSTPGPTSSGETSSNTIYEVVDGTLIVVLAVEASLLLTGRKPRKKAKSRS